MKYINGRLRLCDSVSQGQFGKINLLGYNPTSQVALDQIPYRLATCIFIEGIVLSNVEGDALFISYRPVSTDEIEFTRLISYHSPERIKMETGKSLTLTFADNIVNVENYGKFLFRAELDSQCLIEEQIEFINGSAPNIFLAQPLPHSGLLGKNVNTLKIENLINSATKTLTIIDSYLPPSDLHNIISYNSHKPVIRILTGLKQHPKYLNSAFPSIPDTEIRFSDTFHDRFVIINETEFYHFGHSIKDAFANRYSRFQKLNGQIEITQLIQKFETEWNNAKTF